MTSIRHIRLRRFGAHGRFAISIFWLLLSAAPAWGDEPAQDDEPERTLSRKIPSARPDASPATAQKTGAKREESEERVPGALLPGETEVVLPALIDRIEIKGLVRTRPRVILRELPYHAHEIVTSDQFELGRLRLWNTPLFSHVYARVVRRGSETVAVLEFDERWTITPLFEFQSGGNATWIHLGVSERNLLGRYLEIEGFYENFNGVSGGRIWFRNPRLFDERLELRVVADRLMRPRPNYVVRTTRGRLELNKLVMDDLIKFGARVDVFNDDFFDPLVAPEKALPSIPSTMQSVIVEPGFRIGRVFNVRLRDTGVSLEARTALGYTTQPGAAFYRRFTLEFNANAMAGERWNFGFRGIAGTLSDAPDQLQFFVGGLDLLRGYPDNFFQATAYALYNTDIKFIVLDTTWLAIIPEVFSDAAAIRKTSGATDAAMSVGAGIICVIPKFADSQLRFELAIPLREGYGPGVGLGSAAFF